jgi:hypothetical protein
MSDVIQKSMFCSDYSNEEVIEEIQTFFNHNNKEFYGDGSFDFISNDIIIGDEIISKKMIQSFWTAAILETRATKIQYWEFLRQFNDIENIFSYFTIGTSFKFDVNNFEDNNVKIKAITTLFTFTNLFYIDIEKDKRFTHKTFVVLFFLMKKLAENGIENFKKMIEENNFTDINEIVNINIVNLKKSSNDLMINYFLYFNLNYSIV